MTGESTTLGEMSVADITGMIKRVRETIERHGYDLSRVTEVLETGSVLLRVFAADKFNMGTEWAQPDVKDLVAKHTFQVTHDEDASAVEADIHAFIQRQPDRLSRERTHMAWVLNQQAERLGGYSGEARDAFLTAFRRSMDEAGFRALSRSPLEG